MKKNITRKKIFLLSILLFVLANLIAGFHAYQFTHFANSNIAKTKNPEKLNVFSKVKTLVFGISNPRPENKIFPKGNYQTVVLQSNKKIESWYIKSDIAKGTVILFHGYSGTKASMLDKAEEFLKLGYHTMIVDFMGSGGSQGNQTTIGYLEAPQVKTAYDYIRLQGEKNIYLFGTSMGSVAIMKAMKDYNIAPKSIIIECPFGTMYQTICARFTIMKVPSFPMAGLLQFWGGTLNGFWAFGHNPIDYAKKITCPTLLICGGQDNNIDRKEIDKIYENLAGKKRIKIYENAGHENYLLKYKQEWIQDVSSFLSGIK
jgi:uncharacterized protein